MNATKNSGRGGVREGAGRPKSGNPTKKFSISARTSEYEVIERMAAKAGKTVSRYLVELAIQEAERL